MKLNLKCELKNGDLALGHVLNQCGKLYSLWKLFKMITWLKLIKFENNLLYENLRHVSPNKLPIFFTVNLSFLLALV